MFFVFGNKLPFFCSSSGFDLQQGVKAFNADTLIAGKPFGILYAYPLAQHTRPGAHAFQEIGRRDIRLPPLRAARIHIKLRGIGFHRKHLLLKYIADINNEIRLVKPVLQVVQHIFGTPAILRVSQLIEGFYL